MVGLVAAVVAVLLRLLLLLVLLIRVVVLHGAEGGVLKRAHRALHRLLVALADALVEVGVLVRLLLLVFLVLLSRVLFVLVLLLVDDAVLDELLVLQQDERVEGVVHLHRGGCAVRDKRVHLVLHVLHALDNVGLDGLQVVEELVVVLQLPHAVDEGIAHILHRLVYGALVGCHRRCLCLRVCLRSTSPALRCDAGLPSPFCLKRREEEKGERSTRAEGVQDVFYCFKYVLSALDLNGG